MKRGGKLFVRNTATSFIAFGIDMALLWVLVQYGGMNQTIAASIGFLVGISVQYVLARQFVFTQSDRGMKRGYVYFLANALVGLVVTIGLFTLLLQITGLHYMVSRALASVAAGVVVFVLNAVFNFKEI